MFRPVLAPKQRVADPLLGPDLTIAMVVRVDRAIRRDHVEDPFPAGPQVYSLRPAGEAVRSPPLRQRLRVHPRAPDQASRCLDHALQHHAALGHAREIVQRRRKTLPVARLHIAGQGGELDRHGQPAALAIAREVRRHQRCRLPHAPGREHLVIHAARRGPQLQPAVLAENVRLALHLAERELASAHPGVGLQNLHGDRGQGRGPDRPRGRSRPDLPQHRQRRGHLPLEAQRGKPTVPVICRWTGRTA